MVNTHALISRLGLTPAARHVAEEVSSWQGVETLGRPEHTAEGSEATLDGVTFRLEGRELGHIHDNSEAHIALSASVFDAVMALGGADASPWSEHQAIVAISDAQDAQRALWLFKLSAEAGKSGGAVGSMQFQRGAHHRWDSGSECRFNELHSVGTGIERESGHTPPCQRLRNDRLRPSQALRLGPKECTFLDLAVEADNALVAFDREVK